MIRTTRRLSRRDRRCECGAWIRSGELYLEHVMSPHHDIHDNTTLVQGR